MDAEQENYQAFRETLLGARGPKIISPFVVAGPDYIILRDYGREAQLAFLAEVDRGVYWQESFTTSDLTRSLELMQEHRHLTSFGIADASNVVLAERYGATDILTTDERDLRRVQTADGSHFRLLPYDLDTS